MFEEGAGTILNSIVELIVKAVQELPALQSVFGGLFSLARSLKDAAEVDVRLKGSVAERQKGARTKRACEKRKRDAKLRR